MSAQIEILVSPSGETRVTTHGFIGAECREATKFLEAALGQKQMETFTAEYHQTRNEEVHVADRPDTRY